MDIRKYKIKRRMGFFYIYDALIALSLFLSLLLIITNTSSTDHVYHSINYENLHTVSNDIIQVLSSMKLRDLDSNTLNLLINNTHITNDDANKSIVDILSLLWVFGEKNYSSIILESIFPHIPYQYTIYLDNLTSSTLLYNSSTPYNIHYLASSSRIVSGYKISTNPLGYVARAYATKIRKNTTVVYPIYVGGAGNRGGVFTITKRFYVNVSSEESILNATVYIALHYGWYDSNFISLTINGNELKDDVVWLWSESVSTGRGAFGYVTNLAPYIHPGWNTLQMKFNNPPFNAHTHPGGRIEILISSNETFRKSREVVKNLYLDDVYSQEYKSWWWSTHTGAWESFDFSIPVGANIHNITIYLNLKNIEDKGGWVYNNGWYYENRDIIVYFNGNLIYSLSSPTKSDYELSLDVTSLAHEGTNYVLVYANCYGNYFWGDDYTEIYSNPTTDPERSSRIFVNYTYTTASLYYGKIDINIAENLEGEKENPKTWTKNMDLPGDIVESYLHIAQLFSYDVSASFTNDSYPLTNIFTSGGARDVPSSIFIPPYLWDEEGTNKIYMKDSCDGCDFLPESMVEYKLMIPSQVGYGNTFPTKEEAEQDAIERLNKLLKGYASALDIRNDTASIGNIPWMYGPIKVEVKVWK